MMEYKKIVNRDSISLDFNEGIMKVETKGEALVLLDDINNAENIEGLEYAIDSLKYFIFKNINHKNTARLIRGKA